MTVINKVSIVIPVYNEEANLPILFERLISSCDKLDHDYEIVMTNDGSRDQSAPLLKAFHEKHPDKVCIVDFQSNFGQHMAIMAAFEKATGDVIVTLDADLQNPPEEIPALLEKIKEGHDYVGSYRRKRQDTFFRTYISKLVNYTRERLTRIKMKDHGCMLRAYSRQLIDQIISTKDRSTFIPALAYAFSVNPTEVEVEHCARMAGESKYNLYSLIRLNFDLITGFSLAPLQMFTIFGMLISGLSGCLVIYMVARRFILGPEVEGVFTLFAILFFLISVLITGIGLLGEYLGRVFQNLSNRPRFVIKETLSPKKKD